MILFVADKAENKDSSSSAVQPVKEEPAHKAEEPKNEETAPPKPYYDVVNVSEGFQLRTAYGKKVKPSKLDGLLERRVKQFTLEEKQRLERMRQAGLVSKMAAMKPNSAVKTEGSTVGKQQPSVTPCIKAEENEGSLQVKDCVVKKLNFEQDAKPNVKSESTTTNHSKETDLNAVEGDSGEAIAYKEVNGGPMAGSELSSKNNCISEAIETKEKTQKPEVAWVGENAKKRGYEEMEQGSAQSNTEGMEVDQSKTSPVQVNGQTPASNINPDQTGRVQCEPQKEPVKPLMNGNVSQNDVSDMCRPPPLKVSKLENHVVEEGDSGKKNEDMAVGSEETAPVKLPSSSPSCTNSNNIDSCSSSEGLKTSITSNSTSTDSQNVPMSGSISKPDVTSQAASSTSSSVTTTTQPGSISPGAVISLKSKPPVTSSSNPTNSMTISKEYSTKDRVSLLRFYKSKKARSGTALPSYRKFVTKSSKKSIFVLPNDDLKRLARRAGIREVPIFNYNAKPAQDIWPYPSPRPTFGITWRLVTHLDAIVLYI